MRLTSDRAGATNLHELKLSAIVATTKSATLTDFVLLDLILRPGIGVFVVEEDSLEDMVFKRLGLVQLILEGGTIEAHLLCFVSSSLIYI